MPTAPWKRARPEAAPHTKLKPRYVARAKAAAKKAGRRYPNLVDNMNAARQQREDEAKPAAGGSGKKSPSRRRRGADHP